MPTKKYKLPDGKRVPGTTTIISASLGWGKEGLLHWAWECGAEGLDFREERKNAADAGTLAHGMAEADIRGRLYVPPIGLVPPPEMQEKAKMAFKAYLEWKEMSKLKLVLSEVSFVSTELRFGGTLDSVAKFGERTELVDFKTSNRTYADHLIQLAAYKHLIEEGIPFDWSPLDALWEKRPLDGIHILRFSKAGDFHHSYYAAPRMEKPMVAFRHLRALYDLKKELEGMV